MVGNGLDVDEDPTTCAPDGECAAGIDNALAVLASIVNEPLADAVAEGQSIYVVDLQHAVNDGTEFPLNIYEAAQTEDSVSAGCDPQAGACEYTASQASFGPDCVPHVAVDNATIDGDSLKAGGPGNVMTIMFPLQDGVFLPLTVANAKISGTVTWTDDGGAISIS